VRASRRRLPPCRVSGHAGAVTEPGGQSGGQSEAEATTADVPQGLTPRRRAARRRRRRHVIGWLAFLLVAAGILGAAYATFGGSDSTGDGKQASGATTVAPTTTVAPAGPFKTTAGLNVRASPATSAALIGTLDLGTEVMVTCAVQGEAVNTPGGPQTIWLKITAGATNGFVSAAFVDVGPQLADPTKIGDCPAA
jgi:Bacterial SH3 domain